MASNARFIFENRWDEATLSLSSGAEVASLPLVNSQRYNNSRTFRTQDLTDVVINGDLAYPVPLSGLVLWRHNLSTEATVRFKVFDQLGQTGNVIYDSGVLPALFAKTLGELSWGRDPLGASAFTNWRLKYSSYWFPAEDALSVQIIISDPTNSDGFLEVGRVYLGEYFEPTYNVDLGHNIRWESDVQQNPTAGGSVHTVEVEGYRVLDFQLSHIVDTERADLFEATRQISKHRDVFVSLIPGQGGATERDYSFAAKLVEMPTFNSQAGRYVNSYRFREV